MKITRKKLKLLKIGDDEGDKIIPYQFIGTNEITIGVDDIETCIEFEPKDVPRLAEIIVNLCGKLNNEGQQHIRSQKDKENQKIVDILLKQYKTAKASLKSNALQLKEGALRDLTSKEFMDIEAKCDNLKEMISRIEEALVETGIDLAKL